MKRTLRQQVDGLKQEMRELKAKHFKEKVALRKAVTSKVKMRFFRRKVDIWREARNGIGNMVAVKVKKTRTKIFGEVEGKAVAMANKRINRQTMRAGEVYMDGVICFPMINRFARENNFSPYQMSVLIMVCLMKNIRAADMRNYGYTTGQVGDVLVALQQRGFIERFGEKSGYWAPSLKGRNLIISFKAYYRKLAIKTLLDEKKPTLRPKRHKWDDFIGGKRTDK